MEIDNLNNREYLVKLSRTRMPFGKYKDRLLLDIPEEYLVWMKNKGFPAGSLGEMLELVCTIKLNGLEHLFDRIKSE